MSSISCLISITEHWSPEKKEENSLSQSPTQWNTNKEDRVSIQRLICSDITPLSPIKFTTNVTIQSREKNGVAKELHFEVNTTETSTQVSIEKVYSKMIKNPIIIEDVNPTSFVQDMPLSLDILADAIETKNSPKTIDLDHEDFKTFISTQLLAHKKIDEMKSSCEPENKKMRGKRKRNSTEVSEHPNKKVKSAARQCFSCEKFLKKQPSVTKGKGFLCGVCYIRLEKIHHVIEKGTYDKKNYDYRRRKPSSNSHEKDLKVLEELPDAFFPSKVSSINIE